MERHAAWLSSHFQTGCADGKTAYARQFDTPYESLVLSFGERIMCKDPTLQPAKSRSSWRYGLWLGRSQTSNAHLLGTRVGIVVTRAIRRLPSTEHEEASLVVATRGTLVARRPVDAAAGDTPTVTRHPVERREVSVVPASSDAPMKVGSGDSANAPPYVDSNMLEPVVARAQSSSAAGESSKHFKWRRSCRFWSWKRCSMESTYPLEPTLKSHAPVEEHDESLVPKGYRGRPASHCWPRPGSPEYTVGC